MAARLVVPRLLGWIARTRQRDLFLLTLLLISIGIVLYGLIKDFNKTPAEHVELDEIEEEAALLKETNAPDEVLTGNPPPVDAASGKIEGDR